MNALDPSAGAGDPWRHDPKGMPPPSRVPSGEIKLTITNPPASDAFVPGVEYMITFDACEQQPKA